MNKYMLFLCGAFCVSNAFGENVVLSDTSVSENVVAVGEEPFDAPRATNNSEPQSQSRAKQQMSAAIKSVLDTDTSDPLFLVEDNQFLSDTFVYYVDRKLRAGEQLSYGINDNLAVHVNMLYQVDFSGQREHGFSATEFGGVYRMNHGLTSSRIISDALFGLKVWGSSHVRTPEYADSSYYAGLRFGRRYTAITLAGTVKSTWVFDDTRGLSYLDFMPEMYLRFQYDWRAGLGLDFRRSTNTHLLDNQAWLNTKLLRQYGNTQYVGHFDYEFDSGEVQFGADVKILF